MKEGFISNVLAEMTSVLSGEQLKSLQDSLYRNLANKDITSSETAIVTQDDKITNEKAIQYYYAEMKMGNLSDKTIKQYIRHIKCFLEFANKSFIDIQKEDIVAYLISLKSTQKSELTVINNFRFIKPFFNWLYTNDYISKNPFDKVKNIKKAEIDKITFSEKEIEKLRDGCNKPFEIALVDFLLSTGVRVGELVNISLEDVDFNNSSVKIYAPKTRKYREVYLNAKALKHLIDYRNSLDTDKIKDNALFLSRYNSRISSASIEKTLNRISKNVGIHKKSTVHVYRKTFATQMLKRNCQPTTLATLLGHKDFSTTSKYYAETDKESIRYEFNRLSF